MRKTILLSKNGSRPKFTRWLFIFAGIINIINGTINFDVTDWQWTGLLHLALILSGFAMIVLGIILFDSTNKLAPKVSVSESEILIKEDIYKKAVKFNWMDIKEITFQSFELKFLMTDSREAQIPLKTDKEASIEIKKAIREVAQLKQIVVLGG